VNGPLVIGPASPKRLALLAGCLALSGITLQTDSGDDTGCNYLIEAGPFVALATVYAGNLRISILHDPERAWVSQIKPAVCECLRAHQFQKSKGAHA
jgi:hypothetical protein